MKRTGTIAAAALLALGTAGASSAFAASPEVQVNRAGQDASISESREAGVTVFRGAETVRAPRPAPAVEAPALEVAGAGSRIWLVDRAADKLTTCELRLTTQVGERVIVCHDRKLPR